MAHYSRLPGAVHHSWQWQELAACRGLMLNMFFHSYQERGPQRRVESTDVVYDEAALLSVAS